MQLEVRQAVFELVVQISMRITSRKLNWELSNAINDINGGRVQPVDDHVEERVHRVGQGRKTCAEHESEGVQRIVGVGLDLPRDKGV